MTRTRPAEIDIQCGRGGGPNNHLGNQIFLCVVHHNKRIYKTIKRSEHKRFLAESIIQALQATGAHFLKQDRKTGTWTEIPHKQAIAKVLQALREQENNRERMLPSRAGSTETRIESGVVVNDNPPTSSAHQDDRSDPFADRVTSGPVVSEDDSSTSSSDTGTSTCQDYGSDPLADAVNDNDYFDDPLFSFVEENQCHAYASEAASV